MEDYRKDCQSDFAKDIIKKLEIKKVDILGCYFNYKTNNTEYQVLIGTKIQVMRHSDITRMAIT